MAPGLSSNALEFTARREQARGQIPDNSAPPTRPRSSPQESQHPPEPPTHGHDRPRFPPNADLARRRQMERQALGKELKFVGPPTIINPDALLLEKRSIALTERAQYACGRTLNATERDWSNRHENRARSPSPMAINCQNSGRHSDLSVLQHKRPRTDIADLASHIASETQGVLSDTDSIMSFDNYATDYNKGNPASNPNLKHVTSNHANQMRGPEATGADFEFGADWEAQVADEKAYRGEARDYNGPVQRHSYYAGPTQVGRVFAESSIDMDEEYEDYDPEYQQDDQDGYLVGDADGARTPTQAKKQNHQATNNFDQQDNSNDALAATARDEPIERMLMTPATIGSAPEPVKCLAANQAKKKTITKPMAPPPIPASNAKVDKDKQPACNTEYTIPMRTTTPPTTFDEAKATSIGQSSPSQTSEDELTLPDPSAAGAHKPAFEESLDYNRDELAAKTYDDLDGESFLTDPNTRSRAQATAEQTLEQKLSAMSSMSEEECKTMFEGLTDAENVGTGAWFLKKMEEQMEKLMRAKHARRMIAAKYEHEVKKRNALVKAKTKDVADELEGLKSGLGNLMPTPKPAGKKGRASK